MSYALNATGTFKRFLLVLFFKVEKKYFPPVSSSICREIINISSTLHPVLYIPVRTFATNFRQNF